MTCHAFASNALFDAGRRASLAWRRIAPARAVEYAHAHRAWRCRHRRPDPGLIGDAAACISLLGGEGSGLAMTEASVLAGELQRANGDHRAAFRRL